MDWTSSLIDQQKAAGTPQPSGTLKEIKWPGTFEGATDAATQGATFGFSDEVGAAGRATADSVVNLLTGKPARWRESFDEALMDIRGRQDLYGKDSPQTKFWAEVAGSLGGGAGAATKALSTTKSATGMVAKSTAMGAGVGAATGAGSAEGDWADRVLGATSGGATGAAMGFALPVAAMGLAKAVEISARVLPKSAEREAAMKVSEALARDEITGTEALTRLRQIGDQAFLADVGENMRRLGGAAMRTPGTTRTKATAALERRQRRQHDRILAQTRTALGADGTYFEQTADLISARKAAADPAYKKAYEAGWGQGAQYKQEDLLPLLELDQVKGLWGTAKKLAMADKATGELPPDFQFPAQGTIPDVRALDYIKRALDGKVSALFKSGRSAEGQSLKAVRNRMREIADDLSPAYKEARSLFESPSHSLELLESGRAFIKGDAPVTAQEIAKMSPAEKAFFREGVGQRVSDILKGKKEDADKVAALLRTPDMREKLQAAFESPTKYFTWLKSMMGEEKMNKTLRELRGSPTAERIESSSDLSTPGLLRDIVWGLGGNSFARMRLFGRTQNLMSAKPREAVAAELAKLFSNDPRMQAVILNAATKAGPVSGARRAIPAALGQAGAAQSDKPEAKAAVTFPAFVASELMK